MFNEPLHLVSELPVLGFWYEKLQLSVETFNFRVKTILVQMSVFIEVCSYSRLSLTDDLGVPGVFEEGIIYVKETMSILRIRATLMYIEERMGVDVTISRQGLCQVLAEFSLPDTCIPSEYSRNQSPPYRSPKDVCT